MKSLEIMLGERLAGCREFQTRVCWRELPGVWWAGGSPACLNSPIREPACAQQPFWTQTKLKKKKRRSIGPRQVCAFIGQPLKIFGNKKIPGEKWLRF